MTDARAARRPRDEAQEIVGPGLDAAVLEPSPPAVPDGPYLADDPLEVDRTGAPLVAPVGGDLSWDDWVSDHPEHAEWVARRWLGRYRTLAPAPSALAGTREALVALATHVVTPARYRATGKIGLRWTLDGFGTPFFGADEQVRVAGDHLVVQRGDTAEAVPLTTLGNAATLALGGPPDLSWAEDLDLHDPPERVDAGAHLDVDATAAAFLADWFGFAWSILEELRRDPESVEPSRPQLWPEHFDPAFECGSERDGRRAGYGFSPGDAGSAEPYVYVTLWDADRARDRADLWNADGFAGATLPLSSFSGDPGQRDTVLAWLRERRDALTA